MVTALVLALLAIVPTSLTIFTASGPSLSIDEVERVVPSAGETLLVVAITLVVTALAAGSLGGLVARRLRVTGATIALVTAWLLGALLLPVVAAALGVEVRTAVACFDTCSAMLDTSQPTAGLLGVLVGMVIMVVTVVGGVAALVLALVAIVLARRHHATSAITCLVVALGVLNVLVFVVAEGTFAPYLCLAIGVGAWSWWLDARAAGTRPVEAEPEL